MSSSAGEALGIWLPKPAPRYTSFPPAPELEALRVYEDAGLVARDGWKIAFTSPYRMAIRSVAFLFDAHAARGNAIYAKVA